MALKEIKEGTRIVTENRLIFIMKGTVKATYPGGEFILKNQDIVGVSDIGIGNGTIVYEAIEKCAVVEYEYDYNSFSEFLDSHKDIRKYYVRSLFRQVNSVINCYKLLRNEYASLKSYIKGLYEDYVYYCEQSEISPGDLTEYDETMGFVFEEALPSWMSGYYYSEEDMISGENLNEIDSDYLTGLSAKAALDIDAMIGTSVEMVRIKDDIINLLMNENSNDIFELYLAFYLKVVKKYGKDSKEAGTVFRTISDIIMQAKVQGLSLSDYYEDRMNSYNEVMDKASSIEEQRAEKESLMGEDLYAVLSGSLDTILAYSGVDKALAGDFKEHIIAYRQVVNKNSASDEVRILKNSITKEFYEIYIKAFERSVTDEKIPEILKMFFNFGYVDEELSGLENAAILYSLVVDGLKTDPDKNVYSYYEWLLAVYNNQKNPGRNEFDVDYADDLHERMRTGQISKDEEKTLFKDSLARVRYELLNVFPSINKMTTGRITTFCPVFSEHNIVKDLESTLVDELSVNECINRICSVDFGAYYRQTVFTAPESGIDKEYIDIEVRPDIILAPNVGSRGVMWQEIEGKKRTTPARMYISIFQQEDLYAQLLKLTGQFRWEMCKRMQGARWNDITDRSLTSEYFDYIQYYRKNKDLSSGAKEKVKNDLVRAKNSFREMFIRDYITWVQFESAGSPRLNKVVRAIMLSYVPFPAQIRSRLSMNPMYKDSMDKYDVKVKQKTHRLDGLVRKLQNSGIIVPEAILEQVDFLER